jgi:hypothetical protein
MSGSSSWLVESGDTCQHTPPSPCPNVATGPYSCRVDANKAVIGFRVLKGKAMEQVAVLSEYQDQPPVLLAGLCLDRLC